MNYKEIYLNIEKGKFYSKDIIDETLEYFLEMEEYEKCSTIKYYQEDPPTNTTIEDILEKDSPETEEPKEEIKSNRRIAHEKDEKEVNEKVLNLIKETETKKVSKEKEESNNRLNKFFSKARELFSKKWSKEEKEIKEKIKSKEKELKEFDDDIMLARAGKLSFKVNSNFHKLYEKMYIQVVERVKKEIQDLKNDLNDIDRDRNECDVK